MSSSCGISVLIHGPSKAGKTTLAESIPAPRLILDAEGSTRFLKSKKVEWNPNNPPPKADGTWETCVVFVRNYQVLEKVYQWLVSGRHEFKSVAIDSISEVQQKAVDAISGVNPMKQQEWGQLFRHMSTLARNYRDLLVHETNPVEVVLYTAMSKVNNNTGKTVPLLQGQIADTIPYYVDLVGYLRAVDQEDGTRARMLLVAQHDQYEAGNRFEEILPTVIINPNIEDILLQICEKGA